MVYAYDLAIQLPVRDIYDSLIMLASINAARDMYERGLKQMEDFYKTYGDFFSPISSDMNWYDLNVVGAARNFINNLYANGVDPLRSAEGRSMVLRFIHSMPVGEINKRKQAAAAAQEYIKNRGTLQAQGKWDPEFEKYVLGGRTLEDWDTEADGPWNRTAPAQFKTLKELTEDWYDKRTPHDLTPEEVASFGVKYNPNYRYKGFTDADIMNIAGINTPGWQGSIYSNYYRELARRQVAASGQEVTPENIEAQLQRNIANAQQEWLVKPVADEDQFALNRQKHAFDIQLQNLKHQHEMAEIGERYGGSGSGGRKLPKEQQNYMAALFNMGISKAVTGSSVGYRQGPVDLSTISGDAMRFGYNSRNGSFEDRKKLYENKYLMDQGIGQGTFVAMLNGSGTRKDSKKANTVYGGEGDVSRLYSEESVIGNTLGFRSNREYGTDRKTLNQYGDNNLLLTPTGEVYTAPFKDGRIKQYVKVHVTGLKETKEDGKDVTKEDDLGYYYYELQRGQRNSYTDSTDSNGRKLRIWSDRWNASWDDSDLGRISDFNRGAMRYLHPETTTISNIYP